MANSGLLSLFGQGRGEGGGAWGWLTKKVLKLPLMSLFGLSRPSSLTIHFLA